MKPLIHKLLEQPLSGADIERLSFAAIDAEAPRHQFDAHQWQVVRRLIHTSADFSLAQIIAFSADAFSACSAALASHAPIYADSNMIRSGLSPARLRQVNSAYSREDILCHVADDDVATQAGISGLPRSLHAVRKAADKLDGAICLIGNAPVALLEINRMIMEDDIRPALVIAMPVGFIHVEESKQELVATGVPHVVLNGRRGGSPLAVACLHAMCGVAAAE